MVFNLFKKSNIDIYSPVTGEVVSLEKVPDPVFSEKMMGEGVAINPESGKVVSPVDGRIIQVAPTNHAIGIVAKDGSEILIHVGLETVALKGEGFKVSVEVGQKVSVGTLLMEFDLDFVRKNAKSTIIPIVITNSHDGKKQYIVTDENKAISGKTVILTASDK